MEFGNKWCKWIKKCMGSVFFSLLLNGSSIDFFYGLRGLRQGDPLSPFLFLIVDEAFGALLSKAFFGGLLEGFKLGSNGVPLTVC